MGFFDAVFSVVSGLADSSKQGGIEISKEDKELYAKLSERDKVKFKDNYKRKLKEDFMNNSRSVVNAIQDCSNVKTLDDWDEEWKNIGYLEVAPLLPLRLFVGLYMHILDNEIVYIGRATEWSNGGLGKRLQQYRSSSDNGRGYTSGDLIHDNLPNIVTCVLVVGRDKAASDLTKKLEVEFIRKYNPKWNKCFN